jgi:hypothetical protein
MLAYYRGVAVEAHNAASGHRKRFLSWGAYGLTFGTLLYPPLLGLWSTVPVVGAWGAFVLLVVLFVVAFLVENWRQVQTLREKAAKRDKEEDAQAIYTRICAVMREAGVLINLGPLNLTGTEEHSINWRALYFEYHNLFAKDVLPHLTPLEREQVLNPGVIDVTVDTLPGVAEPYISNLLYPIVKHQYQALREIAQKRENLLRASGSI